MLSQNSVVDGPSVDCDFCLWTLQEVDCSDTKYAKVGIDMPGKDKSNPLKDSYHKHEPGVTRKVGLCDLTQLEVLEDEQFQVLLLSLNKAL